MPNAIVSRLPGLWAVAVAALAACGPANPAHARDATIEVVYPDPERYTDFGDGYATPDSRRNVMLDEMQRYIQRAAAPRLPAGSTLRVTIKDIDMAGAFEPLRGARYERVRIFREVYPPRIKLEF